MSLVDTRVHHEDDPLPSDRSTGLVLAGACAVAAALLRATPIAAASLAGLAAVLAGAATLAPAVLHRLNVGWMWLARQLARIVNPIVMLVLFVAVMVPFGLMMQLVRDPLRRRRAPQGESHWIERPSAASSSMANQF